jgi:uncharacterized protein YaiE (UPF0345 family)
MQPFTNATVQPVGNVYFDAKVVSHTVILSDDSKKTLGIITTPGSYRFDTVAPELMEITDGTCEVLIDGSDETREIRAGSSFEIAGDSGFAITVKAGVCQYVCSYLS